MGKLYSLISALLLTVSSAFAAAPDSYEWWFDDDLSSIKSGPLTGGNLDFEIDTSDLPKGIHHFNLRLTEGDSIYGPVYRRMFYSLVEDKGAMSYEYWLDNNYASKVYGDMSAASNHLDLDISSLPQGAYFFYCRVGYGNNSWGTVYRKMLLKLTGTVSAMAYEYWLDNNYSAKSAGSLTPGANFYDIDVNGILEGLHSFNYRVRKDDDSWGAIYTKYFYKASDKDRIIEYEYWLDNDYSSRVSSKIIGNPTTFDVDLSSFGKKKGSHYFHLRTRDDNGNGSPLYNKLIDFKTEESGVAITGYRHYINGFDLGYVPLEQNASNEFSFDVNIPNRGEIIASSKEDSTQDILSEASDSVRYAIQLQTELGWSAPAIWTLHLPKLISGLVRFTYHGRYLSMKCDDEESEIKYWFDDEDPSSIHLYADSLDVKGIHKVKAISSKNGYLDSDIAEFTVEYYSDEKHAVTSAQGLLAKAFEWDDDDLSNKVESYSVEGVLDDSDYTFLKSMRSLRHLDIENVSDAHIPTNAFKDSRLISISLPKDIGEYGDSILSSSLDLSSVIWNSKTQQIESRITDGLANPNVLLYVPSGVAVENAQRKNIIVDNNAEAIELYYGFPYYAARDFRASNISLTHDFIQLTEIGKCSGWETLVLPFQPQSITHAINGGAVPFAAWDGDTQGKKPFWLYTSTTDGWEKASAIEAGVPYIISMPNNPDYVSSSNLAGEVTFSAKDVALGPSGNSPKATNWLDGTMIVGTFMPVDDEDILSLNVNDYYSGLLPGSTFVPDGKTVPFGAYVSGATSQKRMPLFGDVSGISLPSVTSDDISIELPAPGMLKISSGSERKVAVTTATGITIRVIHLKPGDTKTLEGLTRDLYIVAGRKVMVK